MSSFSIHEERHINAKDRSNSSNAKESENDSLRCAISLPSIHSFDFSTSGRLPSVPPPKLHRLPNFEAPPIAPSLRHSALYNEILSFLDSPNKRNHSKQKYFSKHDVAYERRSSETTITNISLPEELCSFSYDYTRQISSHIVHPQPAVPNSLSIANNIPKRDGIDFDVWKKNHATDFVIFSIVGKLITQSIKNTFAEKCQDIIRTGRSFWSTNSHKSRPDKVQRLCQQARQNGKKVYCVFLEAPIPRGSRPPAPVETKATQYSSDRIHWSQLDNELHEIGGKIDGSSQALIMSSLELIDSQGSKVDLCPFTEFEKTPSRSLGWCLGGSTVCAVSFPSDVGALGKTSSRYRNVCAVAEIVDGVWVKGSPPESLPIFNVKRKLQERVKDEPAKDESEKDKERNLKRARMDTLKQILWEEEKEQDAELCAEALASLGAPMV